MQGTKATMETHLRFPVILGAIPRKRYDEILMTVRKIKISKEQKQKEEQKADRSSK